MMRLMKRAILVVAVFVLCASVSMAQSKGGFSGGRGGLFPGGGGSGNSVLPTSSNSKVVTTRVMPVQTIDPKITRVVLDPKTGTVVETRVTRVIDTKLSKVVETKYTQVIDTKVAKVVETKYTQVIDTKVAKVVETKYTQVIDTKVAMVIPTNVTKILVTKVHNPQVIINPVTGGFGWGNCGCGCGCGCGCCWYVEILRFFGIETPAVPVQYERYLRLHNDTDEKLTVYLRYYTHDLSDKWEWIPEAPAPGATKWVSFELQPNEILEPRLEGTAVAGNRIRLHAESATRSWKKFKDQDYWLVPEVTTAGEHLYYAPFRETYQFYIHNNTK